MPLVGSHLTSSKPRKQSKKTRAHQSTSYNSRSLQRTCHFDRIYYGVDESILNKLLKTKVGLWRSWERASMAWKRSSVRSRPGPPSFQQLSGPSSKRLAGNWPEIFRNPPPFLASAS